MKVQKELLYESGGPIPSCHASTLTFAPDGTLLTAFFGGTKENADDVEIYLCRRTDSGWSELQRMSVPSGDPTWNPVLFTDGDAVHLWYKRFRPIARWRTFTRILRDGAWSEERELIPEDRSGGRGPETVVILLCAGLWLLMVAAIVLLAVFCLRSANMGRSSFYAIGACTAVSILLAQTILNVMGTVDLLPFTGVTFPFVSNGGSSMISAWGMMAFVKAADTRQDASFAIRRAKKPREVTE